MQVAQGITPVHVSTRSTTQYPLTGTYCFVIILITSCATNPPRKADVVGRSAVGDRALFDVNACYDEGASDLHLSNCIIEFIRKLNILPNDILDSSAQ